MEFVGRASEYSSWEMNLPLFIRCEWVTNLTPESKQVSMSMRRNDHGPSRMIFILPRQSDRSKMTTSLTLNIFTAAEKTSG